MLSLALHSDTAAAAIAIANLLLRAMAKDGSGKFFGRPSNSRERLHLGKIRPCLEL
jgi:hypothetical protein